MRRNKRQKYTAKVDGQYIHYQTRKNLTGILYLRDNKVSANIVKETPLKEKDGFWEGKQELKQRIVSGNKVKDISIPLKIKVEINNVGERPTQKIFIGYGYKLRDRIINGLRYLDEEILEELALEDRTFLSHISTVLLNDMLIAGLTLKPRRWTPLLSALQQIYNRNLKLFHKRRVRLYNEVAGHTVVNANIIVEVNGYDYFLKRGSAIDCKDEEIRSFTFELPRAEIVKNYLEGV